MTGKIIAFPTARRVTRHEAEAAQEAYFAHRRLEAEDPGLADDIDHIRERNRLYAIYIRAVESMELGECHFGGDTAA